jgi:NUMOD3 motif
MASQAFIAPAAVILASASPFVACSASRPPSLASAPANPGRRARTVPTVHTSASTSVDDTVDSLHVAVPFATAASPAIASKRTKGTTLGKTKAKTRPKKLNVFHGNLAERTLVLDPDTKSASASGDSGYEADDDSPRPVSFRIGQPHTTESRQKISAANKGKVPWNKGRKHSPETRRKIAEATRRAMSRPETRERLSRIATGRKHSNETKVKIAASCSRSYNSNVALSKLRDTDSQQSIRDGERDSNEGSNGKEFWFRLPLSRQRARQKRAPFDYAAEVIAALHTRIDDRLCCRDFEVEIGVIFKRDSAGELTRVYKPRPPMTEETKMKLSNRIKELWNDPEYRIRVSEGLRANFLRKGGQRGPLSAEHKEQIRQSLLRRNAEMRVLYPEMVNRPRLRSKRPARVAQPKSSKAKLMQPTFGDPMRGSKLSEAKLSDDQRAARQHERTAVRQILDNELVEKKRSEERKVRRMRKQNEEAMKRAEMERLQSESLLRSLASAGQLPPLSEDGGYTGTVISAPVVFDDYGLRDAGANGLYGSVGYPRSADGFSSNNPLVFSSNGVADVQVGNSSDSTIFGPSRCGSTSGGIPLSVADSAIPLDLDIYAPQLHSYEEEDEEPPQDSPSAWRGRSLKRGRRAAGSRGKAISITADTMGFTDEDDSDVRDVLEDVDALVALTTRDVDGEDEELCASQSCAPNDVVVVGPAPRPQPLTVTKTARQAEAEHFAEKKRVVTYVNGKAKEIDAY